MSSYQCWEDFLEDDAGQETSDSSGLLKGANAPLVPSEEDEDKLSALKELLDRDDIPEEIKSLVREHIELRDKLDDVTQAKENPYGLDERSYRQYNLPAYTKEDRLREKQERRAQEKSNFLKRKSIEKKVIEQKLEIRRLISAQNAKNETLRAKKKAAKIEDMYEASRSEKKRYLLEQAKKKSRISESLRRERAAQRKAASVENSLKRKVEEASRFRKNGRDSKLSFSRPELDLEDSVSNTSKRNYEKRLFDRFESLNDDVRRAKALSRLKEQRAEEKRLEGRRKRNRGEL